MTCLSDSHYLEFNELPSPSVLGLTYFPDLHYFKFGGLSSPSALDLADLTNLNALDLVDCQVQVFWV